MSDVDDRRQRLEELVATNKELLERLGRQGVQIDPGSILAMRLTLLIEHLLPAGSLSRLEFDLRAETVFGESLERTEADVNRARLTQGVSLVPPVR